MDNKRNIIILNNKIITDKTNSHRVYPTARQKRLLVDILEKNPRMIHYQFDSEFSFKDSYKLWEEATKQLNAIGGAKKTAKGWKKCWHDLRRNTKIKIARINSFQENGKLDQIHLKIMKLESARHKNTENLIVEHVDVIENVKREDTSSLADEEESPPPQPPDYYLTVATNLTEPEQIECLPPVELQNTYSTCIDKSVNTEKDYLSIEERKLQLKKDYYDTKLKILDRQTQIQERMLTVLKGIATSLIDKM